VRKKMGLLSGTIHMIVMKPNTESVHMLVYSTSSIRFFNKNSWSDKLQSYTRSYSCAINLETGAVLALESFGPDTWG